MISSIVNPKRLPNHLSKAGRVNLNKGNADFKLVAGSFYVYENVDIADWKYIRQQALTGNSMGKAIGKSLVSSSYEYTKLDI